MEKLVPVLLVFLAFHFLKAASQDFIDWWNIDCGSELPRVNNHSMPWYTDYGLITTGLNKQVPQKQPIEEMNTLRFFPNGTEPNCYSIFFTSYISGYIVRAGFYHGNYDGLSRPPTFDLNSNGKNWTTVNTTSSMGGMVTFPLTSDNDPNAAFHLVTRTNFGGPEVR
ncbi:uncharacterized protein At1g24485-like [Vitis riparia]|uniref:uncharacterized protein At1g24485-like n=1 Tax=Vitis riparia TaxID=96939 RepID=UPI00155B1260|nr:uncharacterized protein At1g24485-like [Vitis riparia]